MTTPKRQNACADCASTAGSDPEQAETRRDWLTLSTRAALGLTVAAVATPAVRFLIPPSPPPSPEAPRSVVVCSASELAVGQARTTTYQHRPVIVVRPDDGPPHAFDATCTHLGCTVRFDASRRVLHCACHGAEFDPTTGVVRKGPATRPLARIPAQVRHDRIVIGT